MEFREHTMESMGIDKSFWNNKRVLITGHTGFKGAWLTFWLKNLGANLKGISLRPSTTPNMYESIFSDQDIENTFGDIRNPGLLKTEFRNFQPEIIIHLAAQAIVRESYENPVETLETNIIGTANVLEASRDLDKLRAILCITSDKCYDNKEWVWKYRESDPMGGWDPYSASKGCSELIVSSYRDSFYNLDNYNEHGVAIATARAGNVLGGGDWSRDRLLPDIMRAYFESEDLLIRSPNAIRPWQYILDLLNGYLLLTEQLFENGEKFSGAWNFGPDSEGEKNVEYIVNQTHKILGENSSLEMDNGKHPHEANYLKLDSSKARSLLNWKPKMQLSEFLEDTLQWYQCFYEGKDIREFTKNQILSFQALSSN